MPSPRWNRFDAMRRAVDKTVHAKESAQWVCNSCGLFFNEPEAKQFHCTLSYHCPKCGSNRLAVNHARPVELQRTVKHL